MDLVDLADLGVAGVGILATDEAVSAAEDAEVVSALRVDFLRLGVASRLSSVLFWRVL